MTEFTLEAMGGLWAKRLDKRRVGLEEIDWNDISREATMRALHACTFAGHRFPKAFKERGEKHCYAARKLARKKFRDLFPFLAKGDQPIRWTTKGGRSR